jgi:hypothetical protein
MNKKNGLLERIKIGAGISLAIALLATLTGCVGVIGEGYGGDVVVAEPDVFLFGGGFDRGRDAHAYSHRGFESRGAAHSGGGHGGRR